MTWLKDLISDPGRQVPPIGTFMKIPAVETVEIVKLAGFDFIVLDAEHAPLSMSDLNHMILVARALGMPPIVRVPDHGYGDVQRVLDAGAAGLFFPHVADRAECEQVVRQASHPPYGTRGAGGGAVAATWGVRLGWLQLASSAMTPEVRRARRPCNRSGPAFALQCGEVL